VLLSERELLASRVNEDCGGTPTVGATRKAAIVQPKVMVYILSLDAGLCQYCFTYESPFPILKSKELLLLMKK